MNMTQQTEIDKRIKEYLNEDEVELFNSLGEEPMTTSWLGIYSGKNKYITIAISVYITIFVIAAFYFGYLFFTADTQIEMIRYGAAMFLFFMFTAFLKQWLNSQMDKRAIIRELKRVELQLSVMMKNSSVQRDN